MAASVYINGMSDTAITITLDQDVFDALRLLADAGDMTVEECARRYLSETAIEGAGNFISCIQEGEDEIERGEYLTLEEIKAWLANEREEVLKEIEQSKAA